MLVNSIEIEIRLLKGLKRLGTFFIAVIIWFVGFCIRKANTWNTDLQLDSVPSTERSSKELLQFVDDHFLEGFFCYVV